MKEKILLVDDEEGIREVFGIILQDMGYEVLLAANGPQALEIFPAEQPPIVLADIKMPGMDGIELLRRLKQANPETEVIIITGHGDMQLAIQSLQYEATDFITKPIDERLLARALRKARERIQIQRQIRNYTTGLEGLLQQKTDTLAAVRQAAHDTAAYRQLFDELPGYVLVLGPDFAIRAANRRFKDDFAYTPKETAPSFCYEVLKGSDEPCLDCLVEQTFNDGQSHQREMKLATVRGGRLNVFAWTTPLPSPEGALEGAMLMAVDISQIIDLKDRLASLGLMIGSVSHGIKGLLTGLDGGLYLIDSGVTRDEPSKISEGVATVRIMADRMRSLILDILYYSKERELAKAPTPIRGFMEDVAAVAAPKAAARQIPLQLEVDPALEGRTMDVDADQLSTALVNILENAVEACLAAGEERPQAVRFRGEARAGEVVFHVQDTGIGMDRATLGRIFTLFFSSKGSHGTGIGLFVAKKIVQQHGGRIDVQSQPGVGTTFQIALPLPAA